MRQRHKLVPGTLAHGTLTLIAPTFRQSNNSLNDVFQRCHLGTADHNTSQRKDNNSNNRHLTDSTSSKRNHGWSTWTTTFRLSARHHRQENFTLIRFSLCLSSWRFVLLALIRDSRCLRSSDNRAVCVHGNSRCLRSSFIRAVCAHGDSHCLHSSDIRAVCAHEDSRCLRS